VARVGAVGVYLYNNSPVVTELPVTMACWFKAPNITTSFALMTLGGRTSQVRLVLQAVGTAAGDPVRCQSVDAAGTKRSAVTSTGFSTGTWHHAAGVFTSTTSRAAYIDGGSKGTSALSSTVSSFDALEVMRELANGTAQLQATDVEFAEAAVWDAALSDEEIATLALGYSPLFVRPQSLKNYYPLFGRQGATEGEEDWSGNNALLDAGGAPLAAHPRIIYPGRGQRVFAYPAAVAASFRAAWVPRQAQFIGAR
jgi:hypothetical protein